MNIFISLKARNIINFLKKMKTESFISKYVKDVLNNSLLLNTCYFYYLLHVITC